MINFQSKNYINESISFVRNWTKLLSEKKFDEAFNFLDESADEKSHSIVNIRMLNEIFADYYKHESFPKIENPYLMNMQHERINVYVYDDGSGFAIDYDIPLNGKWSDFTAQFSFKKNLKTVYKIYLTDFHIL